VNKLLDQNGELLSIASLSWDHSAQEPTSEATFEWSEHLVARQPDDFIRLYTDELVEDAEDNIANMGINDETAEQIYLDDDLLDDVFSPLTCRLQRRGAFRNKERSKTLLMTDLLPAVVTTPLLPKTCPHRSSSKCFSRS
jgi:hypothetical protein